MHPGNHLPPRRLRLPLRSGRLHGARSSRRMVEENRGSVNGGPMARRFLWPSPPHVVVMGWSRLNLQQRGNQMTKRAASKKAFGGYAISFRGRTDSLESLFGSTPIGPAEMT